MSDFNEELRTEVEKRVHWWLEDFLIKPPELFVGARGDHYYECMAKDIAATAVGDYENDYAMQRLDPPQKS